MRAFLPVLLAAVALMRSVAWASPVVAPPLPEIPAASVAVVAAALAKAPDQGLSAPGNGQLRDALLTYARAQHGQRLPGVSFPADWAVRPASYDPTPGFAAAVSNDRLASWLADLPPPDPRYKALVRGYGRYRAIAARGGWPSLPKFTGPTLGETGPQIAALRARLVVEDPAVAVTSGSLFDAALQVAVKRAQARYGLEEDGRIGAATLAALNMPVSERLAQIRANLERWRWSPRDLPARRVEVNTADARLEFFDPPGPPLSMRAIVGRADKATPMFADHMTAVVFNPPWNVPPSIAAKEIWPKIRRDPGYMSRHHFVVRPGGRLQQLPGPDCALGQIKFDLGNAFGVYLHDTPVRSLFARDRRALSHGCMRLEDPTNLARRILAGDPDWPAMKIESTLIATDTVRAPLKVTLPVLVVYRTAFVDDHDQLQFRSDVYGWDGKLAALMARAGQAL